MSGLAARAYGSVFKKRQVQGRPLALDGLVVTAACVLGT